MEDITENQNTYELLYMSRQNSQYAFEALFQIYYPTLYFLVQECIANDSKLAPFQDEMLQEASVSFKEAIESYRYDQNAQFVTFLSTVIRKRVANCRRRLISKYHLHDEVFSLDDPVGKDENFHSIIAQRDGFNDPVYVMDFNAARERLNEVVGSLNEIEKAAAHSWMIGESYQEGAEKYGMTPKSWESRRLRVRNKICKAVRED